MALQLDTFHVGGMALARRSVRREPWQLVFDREIQDEDLVLIHSVTRQGPDDAKAPLARLRDQHHHMARLLAEGDSPIDVAAVTGYSIARIRTLLNDPAFGELMDHYAEQRTHRDMDIDMSIRHVATNAMAILQERMHDEPDSFSNEELRKLQNDALDRIGKGPTSKRTLEISDPRNVLAEIRNLMQTENRARIVARDTIEADYTEILDEEGSQTEPATSGGVHPDGSIYDSAEAEGQST